MEVESEIEGLTIGMVLEGVSSTLILFGGQFLLQIISVHLGNKKGMLEFRVHRII